ncbi:hypothetical protein C8J57DRAFT_1495248 [Mycena rebaudengoi]|nr:hypothetical protein C8J57DRAFT_1541144 [Mycena rebaudengoi]KAJ7288982.1 hypothetical protein C8J57DRAFT_1495248 [Mycena rebaudengoi]
MIGRAASADYDPQLEDFPYPLDPYHWLRSSKVSPLIKLAVDPEHFKLWLSTASYVRLKALVDAAHPFLLQHVVRFADGDPPDHCSRLLYHIGQLSKKLPSGLRSAAWKPWQISEPKETFLQPTFKLHPLTSYVTSGSADRQEVKALLAALQESREEQAAQGATARKRARADKSTVASPEVTTVTAEGSTTAKRKRDAAPAVIPSAKPTPPYKVSTKVTSRIKKKSAPADEDKPEPPPTPARETRSTAAKRGKNKAESAINVTDDATRTPPLSDTDDIDPDGPDFQVVDGYLVSKFVPSRKIIEWRTLLEEASESKKPKPRPPSRSTIPGIHSTCPIAITPPIPRIPFDLVERAFHVGLLEHPGYACLGCVMRRKKCVYRGHRVNCYNCEVANMASCSYKLSEAENEDIRHALLAYTSLGASQTNLLFNTVATSQRRLVQCHSLALEASSDLRHDLGQLLAHLRRITRVTGLEAARARFLDVPENSDILKVIDSRIQLLNKTGEPPSEATSDFEEESETEDEEEDFTPIRRPKRSPSRTSEISYYDDPVQPSSPKGRVKTVVVSAEEVEDRADTQTGETTPRATKKSRIAHPRTSFLLPSSARVLGLPARAWGSPCDCCSLRMDYACSFMDYDAWVKYRDDTDKELYDGEYCATTEYPYKELYPLVPVFFRSELSTVFDYEHRLYSKVLNNLKDRAGLRFIRALWTAANYPEHTIALATARLVQLNSEG